MLKHRLLGCLKTALQVLGVWPGVGPKLKRCSSRAVARRCVYPAVALTLAIYPYYLRKKRGQGSARGIFMNL